MTSWNNHKLSIEHNLTPIQLLRLNIHNSGVLDAPDFVNEEYGIEGDFDEQDAVIPKTIVDSIKCPMSNQQYFHFCNTVRPFRLATDLEPINMIQTLFKVINHAHFIIGNY